MDRRRVIFDTNVLVSFALTRRHPGDVAVSVIQQLMNRAINGEFELIVPEAVLVELLDKVTNKPALKVKIDAGAARQIEHFLRTAFPIVPLGELTIARIVRDPDDDVILAYALEEHVDYIVSGDKDLLALGDSLPPLKIRSPQAFLDEIEPESNVSVD